jgi:branched-chain amino acid aminotransferase
MTQDPFCFFNGETVRYSKLHLHISDLLIQRGYGIFDFFRTRNGEIPWLDDYTDRLFNSMMLAEIDPPVSRDEFTKLIENLHRKNGLNNGAFKVIATGGYSGTLDSVTGPPNFLVMNLPWQPPDPATFQHGVPLVSCEYVRPNAEIKTLNYFNTMRLRKKMLEFGAPDVLFHTDTITEASRANLFFIKDSEVFTPGNDILFGVTRKQVLGLFEGIRVEEVRHEALYEFDEVFMASTSKDITPIVEVDGKKIGTGRPGPFTREVQEAFRSRGWITGYTD